MTTTYLLNCVMGNLFKTKTNPALPAETWLGFSSTEPNADGSGVTEPVGGGYARVRLNALGEPVNGFITNSGAITFDESTGSWGNPIICWVIYDSAIGGNLLMSGALTESRTVEGRTMMTVKAGELDISLETIVEEDEV